MLKRHAIRRFDVVPAPNGATAGAICAQLEGVLFDGSEVAYTLEGECCVAAAGERILALFWDGVPAVRTAYADQRSYEWAPVQEGGEGWPGTDGGGGLASGGGELEHLTPTPQASAALHMRSSCSRAMAPAEVLAYELNKGSAVHARPTSDALTIVARSLVAGALPPAGLVERAVSQVVRRNPLLTARTLVTADGRHLFVRDQLSSSRAVSVSVHDSAASPRLDCTPLLNTSFDTDSGDLLRVIVSRVSRVGGDTEGETAFELVTVMFHGICDAISTRDLHSQLLRRLVLLVAAAGGARPAVHAAVLQEPQVGLVIPPPASHYVQATLNKRVHAEPPRPPVDPAPIRAVGRGDVCERGGAAVAAAAVAELPPHSKAIHVRLTAEETRALATACARHATTVHAALGAAALVNADSGTARRVLTSAVDLRRRVGLPESLLCYAVGGFDGSASFEYDTSAAAATADGMWDLARSVRADIVDSIDSGRLLTTYQEGVQGLVQAYRAGQLEGGTFGTVFLSNVGREAYAKELGPLSWREFDYSYGQFLPGGAHYHVTASTFDGVLLLNFLYVCPTISDEAARLFADATVGTLRHMIATPPPPGLTAQ